MGADDGPAFTRERTGVRAEGVGGSWGVKARDVQRAPGRRGEDLGAAQPSLRADGTALDVESSQPPHERGYGFDRRLRRGGRRAEQGAASGKLGAPGPVGQEAEVPDADKAAGEDVKQEATDEFLGREHHHLRPSTIRVVLPAEM